MTETKTQPIVYNAYVMMMFRDEYDEPVEIPLSAEVTTFDFTFAGTLILTLPNHKISVFSSKLWKTAEFILKDADHTISRPLRLDVDNNDTDIYSTVEVDKPTGIVKGIVGEPDAPERLKAFNPEFNFYFEITDIEKSVQDSGDYGPQDV